jgi:hypothetical protein
MMKDLTADFNFELKIRPVTDVSRSADIFSRSDIARIQRKYLLIIRIPDGGNGEEDR